MSKLIQIGENHTHQCSGTNCSQGSNPKNAAQTYPQQNKTGSRKGLYIRTFGCQMNEYDSEKLAKILESDYELVDHPSKAKLILVNTCSVREKPEHKLYSLLGELRTFKQADPEVMIGVGGCVAQQEGERIVKRSREVDVVFGTHNLSLVPSLLKTRREKDQPQVAIDYRDEWEELPLGFGEVYRASVFVSISRGCNKNCTYCIVPTTRGREVSRHPEEILREVKIAAHRGVKEVVLLGQTVNSFGLDLKPRMKFTELLQRVSEVDGIERIRFTSPHPQEVRQDFIDLVIENEKICRHIHMPLQSGNDRILKLMNRNYRREKYLRIIEALRERAPEMAISTDIIVGFPGETEEEFQDTLDIMERVQFESSYSFMFSARPGTKAAEMEDDVPLEEKKQRLYELQAKQEAISSRHLASWVGRETEVLIDGYSKSDSSRVQGRNSQNFMVNFPFEDVQREPGELVIARIEEASRHTLRGRVSGVRSAIGH